MRRKAGSALGVALVTALVWTASAAASCNPGRAQGLVNYYAGWQKGPSGSDCFDGSLAFLPVYNPYILNYDSGVSNQLFDATTGAYGAMGWEKDQSEGLISYAEVSLANGNYFFTYWGAPAVGQGATYKLDYIGTYFHFFENGNLYYDYNAPSYGGCSTRQVGWVNQSANQMSGGVYAPEEIQHSETRRISDGTWHYTDAPTHIQGPTNWYGASKYSATEVDVWDKYCSS